MAGLKDIIPKSLQGQRMNDPSTWSGEGENIYGQEYGRKDQFGFGTKQPDYEKDIDRQETKQNFFVNVSNISDIPKEDILEELTGGYMYEKRNKEPHEDSKAIAELMQKYGFTADHSESQAQRLGFWREAVSEGYYKLKNPIFKKILFESKPAELLGIKPEDVVRY